MNLIDDPWIPVIYKDRKIGNVGLHDAYEKSDEIAELAGTPPQKISLFRLLLAITHAALDGPENDKVWRQCQKSIVPESLKYLKINKELFNLFGDKPFLQTNNIDAISNAALDKLNFGLSAGNNPTLFDHGANPQGRRREPAWIALMLLTYQCFSTGGLIGTSKWGGIATKGTSEAAPCVEQSMLHTMILGNNLRETIYYNLLTKEQVSKLPNMEWGNPVWENMPSSPDDEKNVSLARSYVGRLVPISRAILVDNDFRISLIQGISYAKFPEVREPMATVVTRKTQNKQGYLMTKIEKHPWRELSSVLAFRKRTEFGGGPLSLEHIVSGDNYIQIWTGGLIADKAKIIDTAEWRLTVPLNLIGEIELKLYETGVDKANKGEMYLLFAIKEYSDFLNIDSSNSLRQRAVKMYWATLDGEYSTLVNLASECKPLDMWLDVICKHISRIYSIVCPTSTGRNIEAYAKGYEKIRLGCYNIKSKSQGGEDGTEAK